MNVEYLRKSLKTHWLTYYRKNRDWLIRLGVWINYEGTRRPSSSFILGTLSTLEPQLTELLPLVVDLSSHPDRIVTALGLNFNPEEELQALAAAEQPPEPALLPSQISSSPPSQMPDRVSSQVSGQMPDPISSPIPNSNHQAANQAANSSPSPSSASSEPVVNHFPPRRVPVDSQQLSKSELPDRHRSALDRPSAQARKTRTRWD